MTTSSSTKRSISAGVVALLSLILASGEALASDSLGQKWKVIEAGSYGGLWVRRGNSETWDGRWDNGAVSVLTVTLSGDQVRISRTDSGGATAGATAVYDGTLAPDGTLRGTEVVTWPGHFSNQRQTWEARILPSDADGAIPPTTPVARSLTGAWVHSADSSVQVPDNKVIVIQDGSQVSLTQSYKSAGTQGYWVTLFCSGPLVDGEARLHCDWAPGGNPLGFAGNSQLTLHVSADGDHLDGMSQNVKKTQSQESHYSRIH